MSFKVSSRGRIPPFIAMDVLRAANERAATGAEVLHLELGQPSTSAPDAVIAAAERALRSEALGYTDALGIPPLRRAIARYYRERYAFDLDPERVIVTVGSSGGFLLAFLAAFDPGDRIGMVSPGYPAYRNILRALGLEPVEIPAGPVERFQPNPALLERLERPVDGLIVASPANPTGTMLNPEDLAILARYCDAHGIRLISDEIYHGITYDRAEATALASSAHAIVVNSFSKYFSMTGWRLGWLILPADLVRPVECLAQNLFISPPALSQHAAIAAFDCRDELDANVARYRENRALLLGELPKAGFDRLAPPDGAFYIYADIAHLTNDSDEFCRRVLAETGVAMTPGLDFDPERGSGTLRISFAGSTETIAEATRRLRMWRP